MTWEVAVIVGGVLLSFAAGVRQGYKWGKGE